MSEAMPHWRGEFGAEGRYTQSGLALISEETPDHESATFLRDALANVTEQLGLKVGRREDGAEVTVFENDAGAYRNQFCRLRMH